MVLNCIVFVYGIIIIYSLDAKTAIKLIELKRGKIILNLIRHNSNVITIKKIIHLIYGECLLSQNFKESSIKLWTIQNF